MHVITTGYKNNETVKHDKLKQIVLDHNNMKN